MRRTYFRAAVVGAIMLAAGLALGGGAVAMSVQNQTQPQAVPTQPATSAALTALGKIERGQWTLTEHGAKQPYKRLCLGDARQLLQVRHGGSACSRFVVTDTENNLVVTYDCVGAGNGRTDLRVETPRLVQIQSQGIADGAPFDLAMDARRTGTCHQGASR